MEILPCDRAGGVCDRHPRGRASSASGMGRGLVTHSHGAVTAGNSELQGDQKSYLKSMLWAWIPSLDSPPLWNMDLTKLDMMLVNYMMHSSMCKTGVAFMYFHREMSVPYMNSNVIMYNQKKWVLVWYFYTTGKKLLCIFGHRNHLCISFTYISVFLFHIFRIHLQKKRGWWNS